MAAEASARVIVFEKDSRVGGAGNMSMGPFAVESRLQRLQLVALTREEAFSIFMNYAHWRSDARLVRAYIDKSASTIDWLEQLGCEFSYVEARYPGAYITCHWLKGPTGKPGPGSGALMMKAMFKRCNELGIQVILDTPGKKILTEKGRVVGVVAENKSGEGVQVKAKAVIIGTGGFGNAPEMIKQYIGYEWGKDLFSMRIPASTGDGIKMAWEAGGAQDEMHFDLTCGIPGPAGGGMPAMTPEAGAFRKPNLMVNLDGERFINEEIMLNHSFTANALTRQKNKCGFVIFDQAAKKAFEAGYVKDYPNAKVDVDAYLKVVIEKGHQNIFVADSIEELARKTGINLNNLKQTIEVYNKACENGRDEVFNKNPKNLIAVKQPKFYAGKYFPGGYGTRGGIKINYKTEVLNKDLDPIPGLYAVGVDAANAIQGDTYCEMLSGSGMGFALNSGRIAGENAAKFIKSPGK
jgi:fumarate reductase flavoprotein subunit